MYVLAFNFAETALDAALKHDRVTSRKLLVKQIAPDLVIYIAHLYSKVRTESL